MAAELKESVKLFCCDAPPSLLAQSDIVVELGDNSLSHFVPSGSLLIGTIVSKVACRNNFNLAVSPFVLC